MAELVVTVEGVEIQRAELKNDRTMLGRKVGNDIVLDNPTVSGHHCAFELRAAQVFVEDLRSTNGTFVNDKKITSRVQLKDDDVISIVNFRIYFSNRSKAKSEATFTDTGIFPIGALATPPVAALKASFFMLDGPMAGLEVPLNKAVTTFGKPGTMVIAVSNRRNGYFVARVEGNGVPTVNGAPFGHDGVLLTHQDVLELAGLKMRFHLGK